MSGADYIKPAGVGNFRAVWEELPPETEREDDYGLGPRDNLQVRRAVCFEGYRKGCGTCSGTYCERGHGLTLDTDMCTTTHA